MITLNRRAFLKKTAWASGAMATGNVIYANGRSQQAAPPRNGPNETVRVGCIGIRGRGLTHMLEFAALPNVEVVALCDIDETVLNKRARELKDKFNISAVKHIDLRKLLEDKTIDAVGIATPNHWHSLAGIWAMQAGKHVYVEKPLSHSVWEGRQLLKASRKYQRLCQHGTQGRCSEVIQEAIQKLREGVIGTVYMAKGICHRWRPSIGKTHDALVPPGVNYDLWLGPAPQRPFSANRFHYNWNWFWDYGNGDIGNQGVHELDMARWGLDVTLPSTIQSSGGQFLFNDDKQTPNTQIATFLYPQANKMLIFEVRPWISNHEGNFGQHDSENNGVLFLGSDGYMALQHFRYKTYLGKAREPGPSRSQYLPNQFERFIDTIRTGQNISPDADVEQGHLSSAHCHLANIAYRLGRTIHFDPATEQCRDDSQANNMLRDNYRKPFVIPEEL